MKLKHFTANQSRAFTRLQNDQIRQIADDIDTLVLALMEADSRIAQLEAKLAKANGVHVDQEFDQ